MTPGVAVARNLSRKHALEMLLTGRFIDAHTAERWGLVNRVVPAAELRAEVRRWADEILALSPTALRFVKHSFNAETEHLAGLGAVAFSGLREFVDASEEPGRERLSTMAAALRFNNLKIAASEQAPRVCQGAMAVCGIVGYKNDTPFSVGRHLRDTMSACLMVANERIHNTNASLLLIAKEV